MVWRPPNRAAISATVCLPSAYSRRALELVEHGEQVKDKLSLQSGRIDLLQGPAAPRR